MPRKTTRPGPDTPKRYEEPTCPEELRLLLLRRTPLLDRLEHLRSSPLLALSYASRSTIEEAIAVLERFGWREMDDVV